MPTNQNRQAQLNEHGLAGSTPLPGSSITRAVLSPDGTYIAAIASRSQIHTSRCLLDHQAQTLHTTVVSAGQLQKVLAHASMLRWSPEAYSVIGNGTDSVTANTEKNYLRSWLLVSDGQHLMVLCVELDLSDMCEAACTILADFDLGTRLSRFSFADFVFSHEYAIVLERAGIQASILSLTHPERHDIANIKYPDGRGLAMSHNRRYFSILTRSEGQDIVQVLTRTEMGSIKSSAFSPLTYDAQGIIWCPSGDPLVCVWESATFGFKICFFTANGHHLRQMDLTSENLGVSSQDANSEELGINTIDWVLYDGKAMLVVFNCSGQLFLFGQAGTLKLQFPMATLRHDEIIDGTTCLLWQESQYGQRQFALYSASIQPRHVAGSPGADKIAINASHQLLATKDSSRPWTLWIWDVLPSRLMAIINFRERIKRVLWHPTVPNILLILTIQKEPLLYIWHTEKQQLLFSGDLKVSGDAGVVDWEAGWLDGRCHGSPLLFVSSPRRYDVGIVDTENGSLVFQSLLHQEVPDII